MECKILHSAADLNLFTILAEHPDTVEAIAKRIGADERALGALMDALAAMELIKKDKDVYCCDSPVAALLSDNSPNSVLPMVRHMASLWTRWSRLTEVVKGGKPAGSARFDDELRSFIGAMHVVAAPLARRIVDSVDAKSSSSLIDVGGGSGSYTIAFLRAVPQMKATLFDLSEVVALARERLAQEKLLDRVNLVAGSYFDQELPAGHDLALLSAIIHSNSPEQNVNLYSKAFRALNSGGRILIRDYVMNPDRTYPRDGAIFTINMLVGTSGGRNYTYREIEESLQEAGFIRIKLLLKGDHMDSVVEAFKP
jgi:ubiquinone/menaquinone biosynthesis C-methylase UbiE